MNGINNLWMVMLSTGLLLWSCSKEENLLISKERLIPILIDVHIAEGAMQSISHKELKDSMSDAYYQQIFDMHGVEKNVFDETMATIREDPYALKDIYGEVLDSINVRMDKRKTSKN